MTEQLTDAEVAEIRAMAAVMGAPEGFAEDFETLARDPVVIAFRMTPGEAWSVMANVQLATRHPENTGWPAEQAIKAAKRIQKRISVSPALAGVAESGWALSGVMEGPPLDDTVTMPEQPPVEIMSLKDPWERAARMMKWAFDRREVFATHSMDCHVCRITGWPNCQEGSKLYPGAEMASQIALGEFMTAEREDAPLVTEGELRKRLELRANQE